MKTQTGYTFAEVLMTIALAAILAVIALPSMRHIILNNKVTTKTNDFVRAQSFARSEAIRLGGDVKLRIQAIDGQWSKGWEVICDGIGGKCGCEPSDQECSAVLAIKQFYQDDDKTDGITVQPNNSITSLRYSSRGQFMEESAVKFVVCSPLPPTQIAWRVVTVRKTGSVSVERQEQDNGTLTCSST